ncbi:MAG TPA: hypothetical protein VFF73_30690 [Planctomycetota bacterium]|nr:hypothetical protein [Planctomycetota bacterium]
MTEERTSFLHRLFVADPRWSARWPEVAREAPSAGGDDDDDDEETVAELVKTASTANGAELRKLLRNRRENVVLAALNNPAITPELISELCSSSKATPNILGVIARRKEWSGDPALALKLCLNPKTPYFASRFLLTHLQLSDLREVSQSGLVPPALTHDALAQIEKKRTRKMGR